jgi:hypothetical protein
MFIVSANTTEPGSLAGQQQQAQKPELGGVQHGLLMFKKSV